MNPWEKAPLFRLALANACGIASELLGLPLPVLLCWSLSLLLACYLWLPFRTKQCALLLGMLFLGRYQLSPETHDRRAYEGSSEAQNLMLRVLDSPVLNQRGVYFTADCAESGGKELRVMAYGDSSLFELLPGQLILAEASLVPLPAQRHPEDFDYGAYLLRTGVKARCYLRESGKTFRPDELSDFRLKLEAFRTELIRRLPLEEESRDLVAALCLGSKRGLDKELKDDFRNAGVMHLLAVSGLHVGLVMVMLQLIFAPLRRTRWKRLSALLILPALWIYALLSGAGPSVLRAASMCSFLLLGQLIGREGNGLNFLGLSALVLLAIDPHSLTQPGFQLSYLAVSGLMLSPVGAGDRLLPFWKRYLKQGILSSLVAQCWTTPLSVYYFGTFPLYFLLGNLILLPLASFLLYFSVGLVLAVVFNLDGIASLISIPVEFLSECLFKLSAAVAGMPYAELHPPTPSTAGLAIMMILIVCGTGVIRRASIRPLLIGGFLIVFVQLLALPEPAEPGSSGVLFSSGQEASSGIQTEAMRGYIEEGIKVIAIDSCLSGLPSERIKCDVLLINETRAEPNCSKELTASLSPRIVLTGADLRPWQSEDWKEVYRSSGLPIYTIRSGYVRVHKLDHKPYLCADEAYH